MEEVEQVRIALGLDVDNFLFALLDSLGEACYDGVCIKISRAFKRIGIGNMVPSIPDYIKNIMRESL
jgi:hypothetical protein